MVLIIEEVALNVMPLDFLHKGPVNTELLGLAIAIAMQLKG